MKRTFLILICIILGALSLSAQQEQFSLRHDSLYVYASWEEMFDNDPVIIVVNPEIYVYTPFQVEFDAIKKDNRKVVKDEAVAVALGDSLWYVNSKWLKKNFKGDCKAMRDYVPLYFSGKIAFVQWAEAYLKRPELLDVIFGRSTDLEEYECPDEGWLYLINFDTMKVEKIDSDKLIELLEAYPDLKRRYEMMQDNKRLYMINDFFLQYVERINQDPNVPYFF